MNIGKLDRLITLQAPQTVAQNAFGEPAPAVFAEAAQVWARVEYLRPGSEAFQAAQLTAVQPVTFTIRYRADVGPTWRVVFENKIYLLDAVTELGRRQGLTLTGHCRGEEPAI